VRSGRPRDKADEAVVIVRILTHLGLPTRAPPRAPAQRVDLFQTIWVGRKGVKYGVD
jgi:hypothetical protein